MLFYILHQSPLWSNMTDGKRNVRILVVVMILYILLHSFSFENKDKYTMCKIIHGYFAYIVAGDFFAGAISYKIHYNRSILHEASDDDKFIFDEQTHKYIKKLDENDVNIYKNLKNLNETFYQENNNFDQNTQEKFGYNLQTNDYIEPHNDAIFGSNNTPVNALTNADNTNITQDNNAIMQANETDKIKINASGNNDKHNEKYNEKLIENSSTDHE